MAGFTFHIPYLIRMFTLLLYRWHTSGGFYLIIFYNFTLNEEPTDNTPAYEKVGYTLFSDISMPMSVKVSDSSSSLDKEALLSLSITLVDIDNSTIHPKYKYKPTFNVDFGEIDTSNYSRYDIGNLPPSYGAELDKIFVSFGLEDVYMNINETKYESYFYSLTPYSKITGCVTDYVIFLMK